MPPSRRKGHPRFGVMNLLFDEGYWVMTPTFNKEWHDEHRLGKGARLDDRVQWHLEHAEVCGCRPIPDAIEKEVERRRTGKK